MTLYVFQGLSGSGKSTEAKRIVRESGGLCKRVNRDDLRAMIDDGIHSRKNESLVIQARDRLLQLWLASGKYDVIVDDTNLNPVHIPNLQRIAERFKHETKVILFDVDLEECIARDAQRPNPVGREVIQKQFDDFGKHWGLKGTK